MSNGQTFENRPQKRRISFTGAEEAVILQTAKKRRFRVTFPSNRIVLSHELSSVVENSMTEFECLQLAREINADFRRLPDGTLQWRLRDGPPPPEPEPEPPMSPEEAMAFMLEHLAGEADKANAGIAKTYFIGGDVGAIKIGFSVSPESRLRTIQSCSPIPLRIFALAPGGEAREAYYHYRFQDHRLHGEWFERHPDILAEIERLSSPSPMTLVLER